MFTELYFFKRTCPGLYGLAKLVLGVFLVFLILGMAGGLLGGLGLTW